MWLGGETTGETTPIAANGRSRPDNPKAGNQRLTDKAKVRDPASGPGV